MLVLLTLLSEAFNLWPLRKPLGSLRRRQPDASQLVVPLTESVTASALLVCAPEVQLPQIPRPAQSADVAPIHVARFAIWMKVPYWAMQHRIDQATKAFWRHKELLVTRALPLLDRLRSFYSLVLPISCGDLQDGHGVVVWH